MWRTVCGPPVGELRARLSTRSTIRAVREVFEPIPVDELVVEHYGEVLAAARSAGRTTKATELLIIATAKPRAAGCIRATHARRRWRRRPGIAVELIA